MNFSHRHRQLLTNVIVVSLLLQKFVTSSFQLPSHTTFTTTTQRQRFHDNFRTNRSSALQMCICINCAHVTNCAAYHFVETKHEQPHMTNDPTFEPRDGSPTIHVNVRTIRTREDREKEIERMWREHEEQTKLAMEKKEAEKGNSNDDDDDRLMGENTYDLTPVTTYEYDVVKCEDYVHEEDCWVKNMPEEIKKANPDFVPS